MNDMEIKQQDAMKAALTGGIQGEELSDEVLDAVTGGALLTGPFYVARCHLCDWHTSFDNPDNDMRLAVLDHMDKRPNCQGQFEVYHFNKK